MRISPAPVVKKRKKREKRIKKQTNKKKKKLPRDLVLLCIPNNQGLRAYPVLLTHRRV